LTAPFVREFPDSFEHDDEHEDDASAEALAKEDLVADFDELSRVAQSNATPR
jgi:hypothetical protein